MYRPRSSHDNTAVKDDVIPNIYLASDDPVEEVEAAAADPKVEAHRELFYQQIQGHYQCTNNRAMMSRRDMDDVVKLIKGDIKSKNSTDYKLKKDFAVITYGQHYSLIMSKDVIGKDEIDVSTVPHYCCYKDLFHSIRKCHIDDMGHSGIRKTENAVKQHYVNITRAMVERFIACCHCQLDRKHPSKPIMKEFIKFLTF
jgi:hypothetical protein